MTMALADPLTEFRAVRAPPRSFAGRRGRLYFRRMADTEPQAGFEPATLIKAIAERGDRAAFARLFSFYAPRIKTFLIRRGTSAELAEDLAQEALLAVWRKAASFDAGRATASGWIFAIARNLRIDVARREAKTEDFDFFDLVRPQEERQPDDAILAADGEARVRAAMATLPGEQLEVIRLSYFEGKAHGGIAEALQIPLGTVKSRLRLATRRLRELLEDLA